MNLFCSRRLVREIELIERAKGFGDSVAIRQGKQELSYRSLLNASERIASALVGPDGDLSENRVALLCTQGMEFAISQWGVWRAGGVCVPLSGSATESEWEHAITDSSPVKVLVHGECPPTLQSLCARLEIPILAFETALLVDPGSLPRVEVHRRAMILYTSGTTNKPKGVVLSHFNLEAQIRSLVQAWHWTQTDRIPLFLPLHHIHGIVNVLSCALWSGAWIDTFGSFDMRVLLARVADKTYTIFMAVPTIYVKLIQAIETAEVDERLAWVNGFSEMRLMVSGSAALPASVHKHWTNLTGQELLERYGMTEIGMAISNPLIGERRPGAVGVPLPGVEIRLYGENDTVIQAENEPGEIQVRGPAVFREYWNQPKATIDSFDDGWFRTGDMAVLEKGYYRIMGRLSVDIIKSGGYKLSALEIEEVLLQHPSIQQCAVVGVPDSTWGEAVAVAIVSADPAPLEIDLLRAWCRDRMSPYKIPKLLRLVTELPRNAMGKVVKKSVQTLFHDSL